MNGNKEEPEPNNQQLLTRREFLNTVGTSALVIAGVGGTAVSWDYLSPKVLFEPAQKFKVGKPEAYSPSSVTLDAEKKIFILRQEQGYFYCLSAVCTHLGCLTYWKGDENLIACPCHGSRFSRHGELLKPPAPIDLPHFLITLDDKGELVVDKNEIVSADYILKV